jgi:hypothetical protein
MIPPACALQPETPVFLNVVERQRELRPLNSMIIMKKNKEEARRGPIRTRLPSCVACFASFFLFVRSLCVSSPPSTDGLFVPFSSRSIRSRHGQPIQTSGPSRRHATRQVALFKSESIQFIITTFFIFFRHTQSVVPPSSRDIAGGVGGAALCEEKAVTGLHLSHLDDPVCVRVFECVVKRI